MTCQFRGCGQPAFVCYLPKDGSDPLTLCEKHYQNFLELEESEEQSKAAAVKCEEMLGPQIMAMLDLDNSPLPDDLCLISDGTAVEARALAMHLFMALGSRGPDLTFLESTGFDACWQRSKLVINVKDQYKGLWIGKGGKYIKAANVIMGIFRITVEIV